MTFIDHRADYGYTITTPSGDTIRRIVARDDCRRSLVTNCAPYFNSSPVDSNAYAFDALSRPVSRTTGTTGILPVASTFAYNDRSEVLSATIGTNLFTHAYDGIGNHLLFGDNTITNTFTHNQVNQMVGRGVLDAPPTTVFAYTPDGGLSSDDTWTYAYDAEDQLLSVNSSSLTNGAIRVLNSYDYRHRRTSKTVQRLYSTIPPPPSPPVGIEEWQTLETRTFVYDDWNLIHETISAIDGGTTNITEVQYFWGLDLSDTLQGAGGVGGLLAVSCNGQFYFPAYDNNGNVTKYIDESGNVVAAYEYDDFGRTISKSGPLAAFFRHRFSTKYYDAETGLYYYGYRFYHPVLMRWLNRDPITENGGVNLYSFCINSSVFISDALGLFSWTIEQPKIIYDLGEMGSTPSRNLISGWKAQQIGANTLAVTGLDWSISLNCSSENGCWHPSSAQGTITPIIHLRSSYSELRYSSPTGRARLIKGEMDHVNDLIEWARNSGAKLVDDWIMRQSSRKSKTKSSCEEIHGARLRRFISDSLTFPVLESFQKWDYSGGPHIW